MGHDTTVFASLGEPTVDEDGYVTNGREIACTRFGSGVPLRRFWYKIFEAGKGKVVDREMQLFAIKEVLEEIPFLVLIFGSGFERPFHIFSKAMMDA